MKEVKIYIETTIKGPTVKDGKYAAALVFTRANGQKEIRRIAGEESETTYNRSVLLAAIRAMEKLKEPCHLIIYTSNAYVKNMIDSKNPEKWRRAEWKKAAGGEVQNKELWQIYLEKSEEHEVEFRFSKHSDYAEELRKYMEEKKDV